VDLKLVAALGSGSAPSPLPLDERQRIRCSLTIVFDGRNANIPWGARAGYDTQCVFMDEIDNFTEAQLAATLSRYPWRDLPAGSIYAKGYNGLYPDTDWRGRANAYADRLELILSYGKRLVFHALPDDPYYWLGPRLGWDWRRVRDDLEPVYRHPRVQACIDRAVVAWEPPSDTLNSVWVPACAWLADVFPAAERFVHMAPDHNAPCASEGDPVPDGQAWRNIAPYVHGFLYQSSMMGENRESQFLFDTNYVQLHFDRGINNWPTVGADGRDLYAIGYEYASYWRHNGATPSMEPGITWGHDLMDGGMIRGFGDGSR
jgi:hypothetical protein